MNSSEENSWITKINNLGGVKTPYMLTDLGVVVRKVREFKKLLPSVGIYYAIKSNNDSRIIKTLSTMVDGFDIASVGEFSYLRDLGIPSNRIMYSNPVKVPSHIKETYKGGVSFFAIDSIAEIDKLKQDAPGSTVYLRVKVSDYGSKFPLSSKFGLDPADVVSCAHAAESAGLKVQGLTFHVGSQAENVQVWEAALEICGRLIKSLERSGIKIDFVNIGGGFPANYEDLAPTIKDAAKVINAAIVNHIPEGVRICAEPGRYISANTSVMVASVIGCENRGGADWLYLDLGVFQGLIEPLEIGLQYPIFSQRSLRGRKKSFVLTGPSCDAHDTLGLEYMLPAKIKIGDKLYIGAAGAYTLVYASRFNGFEPPKVYYVNSSIGGQK